MNISVRARSGRIVQFVALSLMVMTLTACSGFNLFGQPKIKEEPIVPPTTLYEEALSYMDGGRFATAISSLEKLERQHPYSEYAEKAKMMVVYANFRLGRYDDAIMAADRYMALYPNSGEMAYVLYLKGTSYFNQIKDITRDQQLSRDAIDTYQQLTRNYPDSEYSRDAREKMVVAADQLAGKEMSVGRYYLGNGQYGAAIARFQMVIERYQTSTHIEEALYRLTEANLALGLLNEAQTATAVLGHNYPSSSWYKEAFELLQSQGLQPQVNPSSPIASVMQG